MHSLLLVTAFVHFNAKPLTPKKADCIFSLSLSLALEMAAKSLPPWTDEQRQSYLDVASQDLLRCGVIGVHDAAVDLATLAFYKRYDYPSNHPVLRETTFPKRGPQSS